MSHRRARIALPLAALLVAPTAMAIRAVDGAGEGPSRTPLFHPEVQRDLTARSAAFQRFVGDEGGQWRVVWDEESGAAHRIWGSGLDLGPLDDADAVVANVTALLRRHPDLVGAPVSDLKLRTAKAQEGLFLVSFQRTFRGIPVFEATCDLIFEHGRLVSMGFDTAPGVQVDTAPRLSRDGALQIALDVLAGGPTARVTDRGSLVILPLPEGDGLAYHLAWRSVTTTDAPDYGEWVSFVDAHTGEVLSQHNALAFASSGTISIEYEARTVGDALATGPAEHAKVSGSGVAGLETGTDGAYTYPGSATTLTTELTGSAVDVRNFKGRDGSASFSGGDYTWVWGEKATAAELSTFVGVNIVRDRALSITPTLPELQTQMVAIDNKIGTCNAFYNGNLNFLSESPLCNNTGRIQDVIYHEYGHGYHYALADAGSIDGSIGEGSGDYLSATITGSSRVAPGFSKGVTGDGAIRDIEPDMVYPRDVTGETHQDGLIWAGAMWDLRTLLVEEYGETLGVHRADQIFAGALMQGPRLSNCYQAALVADDDDGNLVNGTPNKAFIDEAFAAHGLTN